jgi:hypothetical protein
LVPQHLVQQQLYIQQTFAQQHKTIKLNTQSSQTLKKQKINYKFPPCQSLTAQQRNILRGTALHRSFCAYASLPHSFLPSFPQSIQQEFSVPQIPITTEVESFCAAHADTRTPMMAVSLATRVNTTSQKGG